jgi:hypothetical protein
VLDSGDYIYFNVDKSITIVAEDMVQAHVRPAPSGPANRAISVKRDGKRRNCAARADNRGCWAAFRLARRRRCRWRTVELTIL